MVATRVLGEDVKIMVRQGARKRMCFGFCQDQSNDPLLIIEPGKKPEALRTPLKKLGGAPPMIWGTYVVRADQMEMICEKVSAKTITLLKKFLRKNRVKVNVLFYDKGGNLLDSLKPETPESGASKEPAAAKAPVKAEPKTAPPPQEEKKTPPPQVDGKAARLLVSRLKKIRPRIPLAEGPLELKLKRAMAKAVRQLNKGQLQEAETLISVIEMAIVRIGKSVESAERTQARAQRSRDSMSLGGGVKRAQALRANIARAPGPARDKLDRAVHKAARMLKARDLPGAAKMMDRIEKALTSLS